MKKAIVSLIIVFLFGCGPDQGEGTLYTYTIKNESGKNITIKAFRPNRPEIAPIMTNLAIGEKLTKTYKDGLPPSRYDFKKFFGDSWTDSIIVIYEKSKFNGFEYGCFESDRNPLNACIYNRANETFTFIAQDYENAQDCNGSCD
jgi:hypothetical protein